MSDHALEAAPTRHAEHAGAERWLGSAWRQFRLERKMFWRNPSAAFFNFLLPLLLLALFGAIFAGERAKLDVIVPGIAAMSVMSATFIALAYNVTLLRERGILKRLRGTPLTTSAWLAGVAANAVANTVLQLGLVIVAGQLRLRRGLAERLDRADRVRRARRRLLRGARRRARPRDPELRVRARLRQRRVHPDDPDRGRLLRREVRAPGAARRRRRCSRSST